MPSASTFRTLLLATAVLCAPLAVASDAPPPAKDSESTVSEGMRAYVDPETGQLTSVPGKDAALPTPERRMELIERIDHPNGMVQVNFHGQADEYMVAKRKDDGSLATWCAEHGEVHAHEAIAAEGRDDE
jgi:hypothetical protein